MSTCPSFTLYGSNASPYSCKMRALMRYRRLHFKWVPLNPMEMASHLNPNIRALKAKVIPVLEWSDGRVLNDSTVIIDALEAEFRDGRTVVPPAGPARFLAKLLEDFFDEWFMKAMFNRRWSSETDRDWSSRWIISDQLMSAPELATLPSPSQTSGLIKFFRDRQVGRLALVGCEDDELWQHVMYEVVGALDMQLKSGDACRFLLGPRLTCADFALYGVLKQLSLDHTAGRFIQDHFDAAYGWVLAMDDLSGLATDVDWKSLHIDTPAVKKILKLISAMYMPYLVANGKATRGEWVEVEFHLNDGQTFRHKEKFGPYQKKCLDDLKRHYEQLTASQRREIATLAGPDIGRCLDGSGSKL
ncbi:hypothetical protein FOZ63_018460 [Perkinsus olseni]|uniref:GST N-terminal domain-containing protein n=1 Tax=Perkinsus olseni TaxID=32597 RepID=A0A7J6Q328_PEROL|nr:hypothetical protein FOZ63_018460 [Perkinsus olseni]